MARAICDLQYYLSFVDKRCVRRNLETILGKRDDLPRLTREVFNNFGIYLVEFFCLKKMMTDQFIKEHITIDHLDHIERITKEGKGGIILTAHLGNWELGGALLGKMGYPLTIIALAHNEQPVNNFFNNQRMINGNRIVPTSQAIRVCAEVLKANGLIGIAADRDFGTSGEVLDFLGKKAQLPKGAAIFSIKLDAPIIPSFLIREQQGKFRFIIEEPIYPSIVSDIKDEEQKIVRLMREYIKVIEDKIRRYPTQWLMFREFSSS